MKILPRFYIKIQLLGLLVMALTGSSAVSLAQGAADSSFLAGIHWYDLNGGNNDVEEMTGGRGVWVVDQALLDSTATLAAPNPWETPWVTSPAVDKTQPYAKPGYMNTITTKGHTAIVRLHPFWGVNVPHPGDPYTVSNYAEDCKAAAMLMDNVHIWQIGNEANLNDEMRRWNNAQQRYDIPWSEVDLQRAPELYAEAYIACRDKIHDATPATTPAVQVVLMQPCSPGKTLAGTRYMSSDDFLARMIAAVPDKSKIDGFALHSYAQPGGVNNGVDGFMEDLRRQIAIIDQAGLGDRPMYITEFNKHMPNQTEANIAARFITSAYAAMHQWNTGPAALWPEAGGNHPLRGTAWFVYRAGAGWDDYSLRHWKGNIAGTDPGLNPWYAFQQAAAQDYPAGADGGPVFTPDSLWWADAFAGSTVDEVWPLPAWQIDQQPGSSVTVQAGEARIGATTGFQLAGLCHTQLSFTDFALETDISFADAAPVSPGEANVDIQIRQAGSGGPGYSLTLFSNQSAATPGQAAFRRTSTWETYRSAAVSGGIASGDSFRVQVIATEAQVEVRILRLPGGNVVLDWTTSSAVPVSEFRTGGMGLFTYNMRDLRIQNIKMGGVGSLTGSAIGDWTLYGQ